ncbi:hypothetical protein HX52_21915 [Salmonella enterica]|nr:hypothetical protein [Salmonella enterica]EBL7700737.1 hypothetical protein [Salmonella enterica]EDU6134524.1 hypothetical protein [Salmonella enterica subsp. enterica]EEP9553246.1 hypothetical protein [Salmonella enterica]
MRPPTAADIAAQFNSFGGRQITADQVSNIREDGFGGYIADIEGATHNVSSEMGSETSNSVGSFTGVPELTEGGDSGKENNVAGDSGFVWGGESKSESVDKAISDVNQKISEMQKQLPLLEATMKEKQEKIEELKKMFRNHSYHGIRDAQRQYDEAMNKHKQLEDNITALKGTLSELEKKKESDAKEALTKASELISAMGDKIGEHLGDKYKSVAKEIADDIKNFQGKTIRSYNDAMASLNKILSNPAMKVNQADKDALVNAWKQVNAQDIANKLGNLSKTFKVADIVLKVEKVREKSIEGYETGNWGPLMLEVESWVLSGVAVGVAMGILGYVAPVVAATVGLPVTAITIAGIIGISYLASFIDDKKADKINNEIIEIIKPSH